jgi:hypothetical protein
MADEKGRDGFTRLIGNVRRRRRRKESRGERGKAGRWGRRHACVEIRVEHRHWGVFEVEVACGAAGVGCHRREHPDLPWSKSSYTLIQNSATKYGPAVSTVYPAMLVDGNLVTNVLSIGGKTKKTGPDPPKPAIFGGLNTHDLFEGKLVSY